MGRILRESPIEYFKEMIEAALEHQHVQTGELTTYYLINLLAGFASGGAWRAKAVETNLPTREGIEDEQRRARRVRQIVDFTCAMIAQGQLPRHDGEALVNAARDRILELFPGREQTYEIVCAPRFRRMLDEFTRPPAGLRGVVLAFRSRSSEH